MPEAAHEKKISTTSVQCSFMSYDSASSQCSHGNLKLEASINLDTLFFNGKVIEKCYAFTSKRKKKISGEFNVLPLESAIIWQSVTLQWKYSSWLVCVGVLLWPCSRLATCRRCTLPSPTCSRVRLWQPRDPENDKTVFESGWMDGWDWGATAKVKRNQVFVWTDPFRIYELGVYLYRAFLAF